MVFSYLSTSGEDSIRCIMLMCTRIHVQTVIHPLTLSWWPSPCYPYLNLSPPFLLFTTLITTFTPIVTPSSPHSPQCCDLALALCRPVQLTNRCPTQIINCVHPQVALGRLICTLQEPCLIAFSAGWLKPSHKSLVLLTLNWAIRPGMVSTTAIRTGPHNTCLYFRKVWASQD